MSIITQRTIDKLLSIPGFKFAEERDIEGQWENNYEKVKDFIEKNKIYPSHHSNNEEEKKLGTWIGGQKKVKKGKGSGILTKNRIELLESLPNWKWEFNLDEIWSKNYEEVICFIVKFGKYPSQKSKDKEEKKLGRWRNTQRQIKKGNGHGELTEEKIKFLELLPNWEWEMDYDDIWEQNYNKIKEFVEKNGKYPSYNHKDMEGRKIGNWVFRQRDAKKGRGTCKLTEERIKLLESLPNWKWDHFNGVWEKKYNKLKKFIEENKKYPSRAFDNEEEKISNWVSCQKQAKKGSKNWKLTNERIELLEQLPGWKW